MSHPRILYTICYPKNIPYLRKFIAISQDLFSNCSPRFYAPSESQCIQVNADPVFPWKTRMFPSFQTALFLTFSSKRSLIQPEPLLDSSGIAAAFNSKILLEAKNRLKAEFRNPMQESVKSNATAKIDSIHPSRDP